MKPPRLATRLLEWYCDNAFVEDLLGDAEESFRRDLTRMPVWKARLNYWRHSLSLLFSYAIKKRKQSAAFPPFSASSIQPDMIKNYFVVATRSLVKHKFFTIINVLGLAVGMSISLLLIAMLSFLWTYDNFHSNKDRIYRVITHADNKQWSYDFASAPSILSDKLQHQATGINEVVRVSSQLSANVIDKNGEIPIRGYFVDPNFLQVFSFPLIKGNSDGLHNKRGILITKKAAVKLFDKEDPIGKTIELNGIGLVEVTGLLQDIPKNSHMQFEALASYEIFQELEQNHKIGNPEDIWAYRRSYVYLLLPQNPDTKKIENFLNEIPKSYYSSDENLSASFSLQPLKDIVPGPDLYDNIGPDWGYASLAIFMILTALILLPACFNYANISISRALKRMKEIGLRKTMGGQRHQIFSQFIIETVLITMIALGFAYYIFFLVRGEFLSMIVSSETLDLNPDFRTLIFFIGFALIVGLITGIVPAVYFSKLNPIQALKTQPTGKGFGKFNLRKALIVSQFALSFGFIMGVVVVLNQYRYSLNHDFGFNKENILDVELQGASPQVMKNELSRLSDVQSISMSSGIIGVSSPDNVWVKNVSQSDSVEVAQLFVDSQYLPNVNLSLLAGKSFPDDSLSKKCIIVNEEFLKAYKLTAPANALGLTFTLDKNEFVVIGVVKNFHYTDLREPIKAFFFRFDPSRFGYLNLKISSQDMAGTLTAIEAAWKKTGSEKKFMARFFNEEIKDAYSFYFAMVKICGFLGFLAISISCLGLLGMVVFTVENRMKEVGVRKVMGASAWSITLVLSKDFVKLMIIAVLIAIPPAYFFFEKLYLQTQQFYHVSIGVFEITISLAVMLILGLGTILSQTLKAANANPVDTLRYE
ncbi:ABC transporter permease [Cytophagales bacterium WSM2-2]|nr:ABC transporter permease [Cytophagales bacterium WSM2-2]